MSLIHEGAFDAARLDADYTARLTCSEDEFLRIIAAYKSGTDAARAALPDARLDLVYDEPSGQTFDLYGAVAGELRPCFVFIHGGYWRALSKEHSGGMASMLADRGVVTVVPDYALAPAASLGEITRQCRALIAHIWHNAERLGIDRARIVVGGSSAGGHLAGAVASGGWQAAMGLPDQPLRAILPISGLFELAPLAGSHVNAWMNFTAEDLALLSPLRRLPAAPLGAVVALARNETAGFFRQSDAYAEALRGIGAEVPPVLVIEGRNHFDILLDLNDPRSQLSEALLALF